MAPNSAAVLVLKQNDTVVPPSGSKQQSGSAALVQSAIDSQATSWMVPSQLVGICVGQLPLPTHRADSDAMLDTVRQDRQLRPDRLTDCCGVPLEQLVGDQEQACAHNRQIISGVPENDVRPGWIPC